MNKNYIISILIWFAIAYLMMFGLQLVELAIFGFVANSILFGITNFVIVMYLMNYVLPKYIRL